MKTLYLHRHGKAQKEGYEHDFSRSLRISGIEDANRMGRYLKHRDFLAELILSSPAERALQTAKLTSGHTGERIVEDDRLYGSGFLSVLGVLREQKRSLETVRIIGHNPDLEDLCGALCGLRRFGIHLATCGVICIRCDIEDWKDLNEGTCLLEWSIRPIHV